MNRINHITLSLLCLLLLACTPDEPAKKEGIAFHASVSEVEAYSVKVTITHNATNRDAYYSFTVEGEVSDIQQAIRQYVSSATEAQLTQEARYQRKNVFSLNKLLPGKTYTLIVFGMNEGEAYYGEPDSVVFTTQRSKISATINPDWTVEHRGHCVHKGYDYSLINVNVEGEATERFFLATYTPDQEQAFDATDDLIMDATFNILQTLEQRAQGEEWLDDNLVQASSAYFYYYLTPGDYVAYAVGLDADGYPTGHYAKSDIFHVDEYPMEATYANLIGEWCITDGQKTFRVTFSEEFRNQYLWMSGWGNNAYNISVRYNREDASLTIARQLLTDDTTIHWTDGTSSRGKLYINGVYHDESGTLRVAKNSDYTITQATLDAQGNYTFVTRFRITEDGETYYTGSGMTYYLSTAAGQTNHYFSTMLFPFTMYKIQ